MQRRHRIYPSQHPSRQSTAINALPDGAIFVMHGCRCSRDYAQSRPGVYLAHSLVSWRYARDLRTGVEVQNALKDCLKETFPSLEFEVRTPVGQVDCVTVREIRVRESSEAFRCIYLATLPRGIYVLHCFQKKSRKTSQQDLDLAGKRFKLILVKS
jgi:Phage derived protein Gp49-like (DUF891)